MDQPEKNELQRSRNLEQPLIFGTAGEKPIGQIYHRFCVTDNLAELSRGINISNRFSASPGDTPTSGLYFSGYGRCAETPKVNVRPTDKYGVVEVDVSYDLNEGVDDLARKGRYAIFIALRITPDNFHFFEHRIREVTEFARGGRQHQLTLRRNYSEIVGSTAEINVAGLSPEQLTSLGDDLKLMIVDRDTDNPTYRFRPYADILKELISVKSKGVGE